MSTKIAPLSDFYKNYTSDSLKLIRPKTEILPMPDSLKNKKYIPAKKDSKKEELKNTD